MFLHFCKQFETVIQFFSGTPMGVIQTLIKNFNFMRRVRGQNEGFESQADPYLLEFIFSIPSYKQHSFPTITFPLALCSLFYFPRVSQPSKRISV